MDAYTGTRGPFNGSPGVASTPAGNQAFTITDDDAVLANLSLSNYKTIARQKSENSYTGKARPSLLNLRGSNVGRVWDTVEGQETYDAVMRDVHYTDAERGLLRWYSVKGGLVENCSVTGVVGESFFVGVHLEGQCRDVTIRNVEVRNAYGVQAGGSSYNQGDCFAVEGGQPGIVLQDLRGIGAGDSCYDLKGHETLLGTLYGEDAGRIFRFHRAADASAATLVVNRARGRGIWINGQTGQYPDPVVMTIGKLVAMPPAGASSLLRFESGPADLTIVDYEIHKEWRGIKLQENGAAGLGGAAYPQGGRIEQDDGSWVTYPGAPPIDAEGLLL